MRALAFDDVEAAHHRRQVGIGDAAVAIEVHAREHARDVGFDLGFRHGAITILIEAVHHAHALAVALTMAAAAAFHATFHARGDALFGFCTINNPVAICIPAREACAGFSVKVFLGHRTATAATAFAAVAPMAVTVTALTFSMMPPAAAVMATLPTLSAALSHRTNSRKACCCDRDATDDPDRFSHDQHTFPLYLQGFGGTACWPLLSLHTQ